jgi:hypothetical protein
MSASQDMASHPIAQDVLRKPFATSNLPPDLSRLFAGLSHTGRIKITKRAQGEKPTTETKEGTFDSIHKGDIVQVLANGDLATKVSVIDTGKKKKNKT